MDEMAVEKSPVTMGVLTTRRRRFGQGIDWIGGRRAAISLIRVLLVPLRLRRRRRLLRLLLRLPPHPFSTLAPNPPS